MPEVGGLPCDPTFKSQPDNVTGVLFQTLSTICNLTACPRTYGCPWLHSSSVWVGGWVRVGASREGELDAERHHVLSQLLFVRLVRS